MVLKRNVNNPYEYKQATPHGSSVVVGNKFHYSPGAGEERWGAGHHRPSIIGDTLVIIWYWLFYDHFIEPNSLTLDIIFWIKHVIINFHSLSLITYFYLIFSNNESRRIAITIILLVYRRWTSKIIVKYR